MGRDGKGWKLQKEEEKMSMRKKDGKG